MDYFFETTRGRNFLFLYIQIQQKVNNKTILKNKMNKKDVIPNVENFFGRHFYMRTFIC